MDSAPTVAPGTSRNGAILKTAVVRFIAKNRSDRLSLRCIRSACWPPPGQYEGQLPASPHIHLAIAAKARFPPILLKNSEIQTTRFPGQSPSSQEVRVDRSSGCESWHMSGERLIWPNLSPAKASRPVRRKLSSNSAENRVVQHNPPNVSVTPLS